jgi:hypothetical protein
MAMTTPNIGVGAKDVLNTLYNATIVTGAVVGARYLTKSFGMKDRPIDFKLKNVTMLILDMFIGNYVVKKLHDNNILPDKIVV